nr:immunoglobulin light chain junction region [Macaca mulatta]MOW01070.1 immunoglobulin light chain junction region [Macaca mulatta]
DYYCQSFDNNLSVIF